MNAADILDSLGDAVVAVDLDERVLLWSAGAERSLGLASDQAVGEALPAWSGLGPVVPIRAERRLRLGRQDGGGLEAVVVSTPLPGPDGRPEGTVLVIKDMAPWLGSPDQPDARPSPSVDPDERLGATLRPTLETTGLDFAGVGARSQLGRRLAEQGRRLVPGTECLILVVPAEDPASFDCLAGSGDFVRLLVGRRYPLAGSLAGRALAARLPVESTRMDREGADPPAFRGSGFSTMRLHPMLARGPLADGRTLLGALCVMRREPVPFTAEERAVIDLYGQLVALALERASYREAAGHATARLRLAVDAALELSLSLDVEVVAGRLVRLAVTALQADRCVLLRVEGEMEQDVVVAAAFGPGPDGPPVGNRIRLRDSPQLSDLLAGRTPAVATPAAVAVMPAQVLAAVGSGGDSHLALQPLWAGDRLVAVLGLARQGGRGFGPEDLATMQALAAPAALALRNALLFQEVEGAGRVKSDFLSLAAHELRTPLSVVRGYVSMFRDGTLGEMPASWAAPLDVLRAKSDELGRLVDNLLEAGRLETGRAIMTREPVDLAAAAARAVKSAGDAAEVEAPPAPVVAIADPRAVATILHHLLTNAAAFSTSGGCRPVVRVEAGPEKARVTVQDCGPAIPEADRDRIFERFTRLERRGRPPVPGTGLGLYIGRKLAELMRGGLELEAGGQGAGGNRFALSLPLARESAASGP
ncbi:MAG: GAF domain-containing protein [Candidatus Dormibacteraeota bacterium]|nr:GAF domain-containing protein [Candidatus Dormibacteraeota bacterium]